MFVSLMVLKATCNNISAISCGGQVLLVEEAGVPGENHRSVANHNTLYHACDILNNVYGKMKNKIRI